MIWKYQLMFSFLSSDPSLRWGFFFVSGKGGDHREKKLESGLGQPWGGGSERTPLYRPLSGSRWERPRQKAGPWGPWAGERGLTQQGAWAWGHLSRGKHGQMTPPEPLSNAREPWTSPWTQLQLSKVRGPGFDWWKLCWATEKWTELHLHLSTDTCIYYTSLYGHQFWAWRNNEYCRCKNCHRHRDAGDIGLFFLSFHSPLKPPGPKVAKLEGLMLLGCLKNAGLLYY